MNQELSKKLKEAGFKSNRIGRTESGEIVDCPDLAELIEACEPYFCCLNRRESFKNGVNDREGYIVKWEAIGVKDSISYRPEADTTEEAVSNLWLKLNHHV